MSDDQTYFDVCKKAVQQNGLALEFVKLDEIIKTIEDKYTITNYLLKYKNDISEICKLACEHDILAFKHVNNIIIMILNINKKIIIIDKQIYFDICIKAVVRDGNALQDVKSFNLLSDTNDKGNKPYETICMEAVRQNGLALKHVSTNIISSVLKEIQNIAIKQNSNAKNLIL